MRKGCKKKKKKIQPSERSEKKNGEKNAVFFCGLQLGDGFQRYVIKFWKEMYASIFTVTNFYCAVLASSLTLEFSLWGHFSSLKSLGVRL